MQAVSAAEREGRAADVRLAQLEANIAAAQVWHSLGKLPLSDCCTHLCGWFECYWLDTGWTSECMLVVYRSTRVSRLATGHGQPPPNAPAAGCCHAAGCGCCGGPAVRGAAGSGGGREAGHRSAGARALQGGWVGWEGGMEVRTDRRACLAAVCFLRQGVPAPPELPSTSRTALHMCTAPAAFATCRSPPATT